MATDNIISFETARARVNTRQGADKRLHPRLESSDRLFAQVVVCSDDPEVVGTTLSCMAVNFSVGGVQFRTDQPVPIGAVLDLWVDVSTRPGKFFLTGEVRWSRPSQEPDSSEWFVGVQLKSGAATDIIDWRDYHASAASR
ncbi:MAG: PilZ domain-containing protein [Proteobacteria bacterium]|nr:PilZ domain-containing protein [Pseudomonadota bacterium]